MAYGSYPRASPRDRKAASLELVAQPLHSSGAGS
jgi:hypothetical protein